MAGVTPKRRARSTYYGGARSSLLRRLSVLLLPSCSCSQACLGITTETWHKHAASLLVDDCCGGRAAAAASRPWLLLATC